VGVAEGVLDLGPPKIVRAMFVLIVGCGRVGSSVARTMLKEGHEVFLPG